MKLQTIADQTLAKPFQRKNKKAKYVYFVRDPKQDLNSQYQYKYFKNLLFFHYDLLSKLMVKQFYLSAFIKYTNK